MAEMRDRIRREQLRHGVASVVRDLILSRQVKPGDILRLGPIAEQLGISITPVREALLLLAQDGWLAQEPNRGFLVLPTRRSDVEDIYLMWAAAEGAQATRAAQLATPADVEALRKIDSELHNLDDQTPPRALELNGEVHDAIHRIAEPARRGDHRTIVDLAHPAELALDRARADHVLATQRGVGSVCCRRSAPLPDG